MLRQYNPQRFTMRNGHRVGTVPVGTIIRSNGFQIPMSNRQFTLGRGPFIIVAWLNREYSKQWCVVRPGRFVTVYRTGGHLAVVKSLADGRLYKLADHYILAAYDAGDTE